MRLKNELYDDEQSKIKKELIDILELILKMDLFSIILIMTMNLNLT